MKLILLLMKWLLITLLFIFFLAPVSKAQTDVFGNNIPRKKLPVELVPKNRLDELGRKQGLWQKYYPNNSPAYRARFVDDVPVDTLTRYYLNGKTMAQVVFEKGSARGSGCIYGEDGEIIARGQYLGTQKDSLWYFYNPKGELVSKERYCKGVKQGPAFTFFKDGAIAAEITYDQDVKEGVEKQYFPDGALRMSINWHQGLMQGPSLVFYWDGNPKVKGHYLQGQRNGTWSFYNEKGDLDYVLIFEKGKLLNEALLDSLQRERFLQFEQNKGQIKDPEDFQSNPTEYLRGF